MGCGKTTFGKKLSLSSGLPHVDLDSFIEKQESRSISSIFEEEGEETFRKIENNCLRELLSQNGVKIISLGGGTVCYHNNLSLVKSSGTLIYIELSAKSLTQRLLSGKLKRPLLKNLSDEDLFLFVEKKLQERLSFYQEAHLVLNGLNLNVKGVLKQLEFETE
jgi:shikimate kinase